MKAALILLFLSITMAAQEKPKSPTDATRADIREAELALSQLDVQALTALGPIRAQAAIIHQQLSALEAKALKECGVDAEKYTLNRQTMKCELKPPPPAPIPPLPRNGTGAPK